MLSLPQTLPLVRKTQTEARLNFYFALPLAEHLIVISSRTYSSTPGNAVDVPDFDSGTLQANGWIFVALSGPTSGRPTELEISASTGSPLSAGLKFFDTTVGKLIVFDGATWRDPANGHAI